LAATTGIGVLAATSNIAAATVGTGLARAVLSRAAVIAIVEGRGSVGVALCQTLNVPYHSLG